MKFSMTLSFPFINTCVIKGRCKYKFLKKCFIEWKTGDWSEDATCVINEKYSD
jgi:hypothetical protein